MDPTLKPHVIAHVAYAKPCTLGDFMKYNPGYIYPGSPDALGYSIVTTEGRLQWICEADFETSAYDISDDIPFPEALMLLYSGYAIKRVDWGRAFIWTMKQAVYTKEDGERNQHLAAAIRNGQQTRLSILYKRDEHGDIYPGWTPSTEDMLSYWTVVRPQG